MLRAVLPVSNLTNLVVASRLSRTSTGAGQHSRVGALVGIPAMAAGMVVIHLM